MVKQKVLFLAESLNIGGAEKALLTILKHLSESDVNLMLISASGEFLNELEVLRHVNLRYYVKPSNSVIKSIFNSLKIKLLYKWLPDVVSGNILCKGYDIVIAFCEGYLTKWVAASTIKCKKIAWVHTDMVNNNWPLETGVFSNFEAEKVAYQKYDYVFGVSDIVSQGIRSRFALKNVSTIYNLLDADIIEKSEASIEYNPTNKLNIVSVGRLESVKGYDNLIEAIGEVVNQRNLDISLCLVGDGRQRDHLEDKVNSLNLGDRVVFVGSQTNPYPYIKKADVYVCSSLQEGFNITIQEAMILGKPVISTNCAGPREILDVGRYGVLVDNSVNGLVEGIVKLYNNISLLKEYSTLSLKRANDFSSEEQIKKINELIGNL